jgi:hypothetical protein
LVELVMLDLYQLGEEVRNPKRVVERVYSMLSLVLVVEAEEGRTWWLLHP